MAKSANAALAGKVAADLLIRSIPGKRSHVAIRCELAGIVAQKIWGRFKGVGPFQWQLKHLDWFLSHAIATLLHKRQYDFWLTIRALLIALGRSDLIAVLVSRQNATYVRPTGVIGPLKVGRPAKLPKKLK